MQLSIVTTMYRSANYLAEFCQRASAAALQCVTHYEIILVNDVDLEMFQSFKQDVEGKAA